MGRTHSRRITTGWSVTLLALALAVGTPASASAITPEPLAPQGESAAKAAPSTGPDASWSPSQLTAVSPFGAYAGQPWPWRSATLDDAIDDNGGSDSADIWDASVRYDPLSGQVDWQIRVYAPVSSTVRYGGFLGHWSGSSCVADIELAHYGSSSAWFAGGSQGTASYRVDDTSWESGNVVLLSAATGFRSTAVNCAYARTSTNTQPPTYYDTAGAGDLVVPAQPQPALGIAAPASRTGKKGKRTRIKVRIANTSSVPAPGTVVVVTGGKPARKVHRLGTLAPGAARTVTVRAVVAAKPRKVVVRASATGVATVTRTTTVRPKKRPRPAPKPSGGSLAGRYFWHTQTGYGVGWDNHGLAFVDRKWAYIGFPPAGLPRCTRQTSVDGGEGCVRYSWSKRTGALRVGKTKGRYRGGTGLTFDKTSYVRLALPKAGSRMAFSLYRKDFSGCMGSPFCTTWTTYLSLDKAGRFVRSGSMLSSIGSPLTVQTWASAGNSSKGTYRIGRRGLITLRYADGQTVRSTLGIAYHKGRPAPAYGVMLGEENYYR